MKKLSFLLLLSFILISSSCKNTRKSNPMCLQHHLGTFRMVDNNQNIVYIITREENLQVERNQTNSEVASYHLSWINDCTYRLTFKDGPDWLRNIWQQRVLTVNISDATESEYSFRAKFSDDEMIIENTIEKLDNI